MVGVLSACTPIRLANSVSAIPNRRPLTHVTLFGPPASDVCIDANDNSHTQGTDKNLQVGAILRIPFVKEIDIVRSATC